MNDRDGQAIRDRVSRPNRALRAALWCRAAKAWERGIPTYV